MKFFSSLAVALLALPALATPGPDANAQPAQPQSPAPALEDRTWFSCTNFDRATCYAMGMDMDSNCFCRFTSGKVPQPCGDKSPTTCRSITSLVNCWNQGKTADGNCRCVSSTSSSAPPAATSAQGTCRDFFRIATCALVGKKTDGNCNCVSGTETHPGGSGWQSCGDATKLGNCWKQGWGCNAKCVCETPSATTSASKTSTTPAPTASAPAPGQCTDWIRIVQCAWQGQKTDGNCNCVSGTPSHPGGSGWQMCGDASKVGNCWRQGWGCNSKCICENPTTSATTTSTRTSTTPAPTTSAPAPGQCYDWYKIAICHLKGMKTDGNCACIPGTPTVPGGGSDCKDANALANCWKVGHGCNARCVCEPISSSTTSTSVKPSTTSSAAPTTSAPAPGQCYDWYKIAICHLKGMKTDGNCACIPGTPTVPGGGSDCKDANALANCWKVGHGCNARCVCEPISSSTAPTTTPKPSVTPTTSPAPTTSAPTPGKCLDWYKIAICHLKGMKTDGNCNCIPGTPTVPGGGSDCKDANALANCWKVGHGCNARCVCEPISSSTTPKPTTTSTTPTTPTTTTVPGKCFDWYKIAVCHLKGMKTDGACNCIPGTPTVPGGGSDCKDPNALSNCWKVGFGCNARCVCVSTTTTATPTPTPSTPTEVGQCKDQSKIAACAARGLGVNSDCSCNRCDCRAQWDCHRRGGTYDSMSCQCVMPTGLRKRRDATYVNNLCSENQTACRLDSAATGWDGRFECVDTSRNIESCGGCVAEGMGTDCTAIEGVNDVACVASRCVVATCLRGWSLVDGTCQPDITSQQKPSHQRTNYRRRSL